MRMRDDLIKGRLSVFAMAMAMATLPVRAMVSVVSNLDTNLLRDKISMVSEHKTSKDLQCHVTEFW